MKRLLAMAAVSAAMVVATACSSSSSSGGGPAKTLASNTYTYSGSNLTTDTCGYGPASVFDGDTQALTVTTTTVSFDYSTDRLYYSTAGSATIDATLTGNNFAAPEAHIAIDWTTTASQIAASVGPLSTGYNCVELRKFNLSGTITGTNTFSKTETVDFTMVSGVPADCIAAITSDGSFTPLGVVPPVIPCTSVLAQNGA